ncbi:heavy-metal-associated domain-containing protein [Williamsia sp. SKLECPSW1]
MAEFTVPVDGLHCEGCVDTVTGALSALPGVSSVAVDLDTKGVSQVRVDADSELSDGQIADALSAKGNFTIAR